MQKFIGTKELLAKPMTKSEYCEYRKWDLPKDEDPNEPGYLVEYLDGGAPNHENHKGYISWSPKDVFERSYRPSATAYERVVIEADGLQSKLGKLNTFLVDPAALNLGQEDHDLLVAQKAAMEQYLHILGQRRTRMAPKE